MNTPDKRMDSSSYYTQPDQMQQMSIHNESSSEIMTPFKKRRTEDVERLRKAIRMTTTPGLRKKLNIQRQHAPWRDDPKQLPDFLTRLSQCLRFTSSQSDAVNLTNRLHGASNEGVMAQGTSPMKPIIISSGSEDIITIDSSTKDSLNMAGQNQSNQLPTSIPAVSIDNTESGDGVKISNGTELQDETEQPTHTKTLTEIIFDKVNKEVEEMRERRKRKSTFDGPITITDLRAMRARDKTNQTSQLEDKKLVSTPQVITSEPSEIPSELPGAIVRKLREEDKKIDLERAEMPHLKSPVVPIYTNLNSPDKPETPGTVIESGTDDKRHNLTATEGPRIRVMEPSEIELSSAFEIPGYESELLSDDSTPDEERAKERLKEIGLRMKKLLVRSDGSYETDIDMIFDFFSTNGLIRYDSMPDLDDIYMICCNYLDMPDLIQLEKVWFE